ncbi:unnamed protein product [Ilex paraguariensis]|uniref:Uncharacterized protein n=1 Tax=Ilex paraguariensis TaxID=185542 RepID=A0ABC8U0B6_9AQUA
MSHQQRIILGGLEASSAAGHQAPGSPSIRPLPTILLVSSTMGTPLTNPSVLTSSPQSQRVIHPREDIELVRRVKGRQNPSIGTVPRVTPPGAIPPSGHSYLTPEPTPRCLHNSTDGPGIESSGYHEKGQAVMTSDSIIDSLDTSFVISGALIFDANMERHRDYSNNGLMMSIIQNSLTIRALLVGHHRSAVGVLFAKRQGR